jgi:hypothetical protein
VIMEEMMLDAVIAIPLMAILARVLLLFVIKYVVIWLGLQTNNVIMEVVLDALKIVFLILAIIAMEG